MIMSWDKAKSEKWKIAKGTRYLKIGFIDIITIDNKLILQVEEGEAMEVDMADFESYLLKYFYDKF